ncbi:S-adenosyl methyltransferase [Murinocardiopsis flavida]|uniref:S-adenosyl methyltransferase n=1 Tax=Murinocardiopsis flavida TaxID=645275 RepID=A0A2P8CJ69_9ACTN|nr:SAM-dependent methyltransferase [Murinocardiopsis flavida]PSK85020.1 S-adenosyl methyltransferase [Murinocardiopsis flavida]
MEQNPLSSHFPPDIDMTTPTVARTYDALLDGKDHFAPDAAAAEVVEGINPGTKVLARENRAFLSRAVEYIARDLGITQFIDLGSGLPAAENTHQVAQRVHRRAHVVYVDIDPIVLVHGRAILADTADTTVITSDLRDVDRVMGAPRTIRLIDLSKPVCIMLVSLLHCIPDSDDPFGLVRRYFDRLPSGSALVFSHLCADDPASANAFTEGVHKLGMEWGRVRSPRECARAMDGLEIVSPALDGGTDPVLVDCVTWRNGDAVPRPLPADPNKLIWEHAGVGIKP